MATERTKSASTKAHLIRTASRLFAQEGLDAVSLRRIAAEAGQRNGSVLQYHFGTREALIDAIVRQRMEPINDRRRELLERSLSDSAGSPSVVALVTVLVVPLAEQLLDGDEGAHYVRLLGELFSRGGATQILSAPGPWNEAFFDAVAALATAIPGVDREVLGVRLRLMAGQLVQAMSAAELELRDVAGAARRDAVRVLADQLVDYVAGALVADTRADVGAVLRQR